jgi:hypothetical protein
VGQKSSKQVNQADFLAKVSTLAGYKVVTVVRVRSAGMLDEMDEMDGVDGMDEVDGNGC